MNHRNFFRAPAMVTVAVVAAASLHAADVRRLTLTEAVHLAIRQNRALKIARLKVTENEYKKAREHSAYFPAITNQSNALHITDLQIVEIPAGTFGRVAGTPIPAQSLIVPQGQLTFFTSGTMIAQPLTQLIRIHVVMSSSESEQAKPTRAFVKEC